MIVLSFYLSGRDKRTEIKRSCGPDGRLERKMKNTDCLTVIASAITLRFANAGISDNIDLIRCNIFGMDVARLTEQQKGSVLFDTVKNSTGYRGLPIFVDDHVLQEIIEQAEYIYNHAI